MNHGGFEIQRTRNEDGETVLKLSGELDLSGTDELLDEFQNCPEGEAVVVDTTELTFLDSTGLGTLIQGGQLLGEDRFRLIPGEATQRLLEMTGTGEQLGVESSANGDAEDQE